MLTYERTISRNEAEKSYIMVESSRLAFFPINASFSVLNGRSEMRRAVESYSCECRGPETPHKHYFIRWEGLQEGDRIMIRKDQKKPGRYILQVRSTVAQRELCG